MTIHRPPSTGASRRGAAFQSTLWSQVRAAGRCDPNANAAATSAEALEALCRVYWTPIHAFLRHAGHEAHNAKDLTQGFFAYLLEERLLEKADPARGRFRSFLIGSLKYYVSNQQARDRARKRGGGIQFVALDVDPDADSPPPEPVTRLTPERIFDRKWAMSVLAEAMERLATEYRRGGLGAEFALLQPHLTGEADERLPALASRLGKSDGATRVLVCRLRNRFRRLVRAVVADTVSDLGQVEAELQHLEAALRDGGEES